MKPSEFEARMQALAIQKAEQEVRAARAAVEREELMREFLFDAYAKEAGRDKAMEALSRLKISLPNLFKDAPVER